MVTIPNSSFASLAEAIQKPAPPERKKPKVGVVQLRRLLKRIAEMEAEAIRLAVPMPHVADFYECRKRIRILDGANQSGKTFHANIEIARALLGCDPYDKYPKKNGRAVFCGFDGDHLSDPMRKKLFEPGEFQLIPDEHTKKLRAVRFDPNDPSRLDPYDVAYKEKWQDAPPLIPPRMVESWAWDERGKGIPRVTTLKNGWRILWRTSGGRPPRGIQIHLAFIDEDLQYPHIWVPELIPRLLKHGGRFIWSATPQEGGPELYQLRLQADADSKHVSSFTMLIADNPYIAEEDKQFLLDTLSEEELAVRYYGQYSIVGRRVYPTYDPMGPHGCDPFEIPPDWCRYVILDPGVRFLATLFGAVDPQERHRVIYDGFVMNHAEVSNWAAKIRSRQGDHRFEAFVIDQRAGRQHSMANTGLTHAEQYFKALSDVGVHPRRQGPMGGFMPGSDDILGRQTSLVSWLEIRGSGPFKGEPLLQIMRGICPKLDTQIRLAQTDSKNPDKRAKMQEDLVQCLEYWAAYNPGYFAPEAVSDDVLPQPLTVWESFQKKKGRRKVRERAVNFGNALEIG